MTHSIYIWILAVGLIIVFAACARHNGRQTGAAGGAVLGQVAGGTIEATLLDDAPGDVLGYIVGDRMESNDRAQLQLTLETSPSYETSTWSKPDTGDRFAVTPEPVYKDPPTSLMCRNVRILAEINGRIERTDAIACRQNGRWVLQ